MPDGPNIIVGAVEAPSLAANSVLGNPTTGIAQGVAIPHTSAARDFCTLADLAAQKAYLGIGAPVNPSDFLQKANNLSDVANAATARANIGAAGVAADNTFTGNNLFNGYVDIANNRNFLFKGSAAGRYAYWVMQSNDDFILYATDSAGTNAARIGLRTNMAGNPTFDLHNSGIRASWLNDPGIGAGNFANLWVSNNRVHPMTKIYDGNFTGTYVYVTGIPSDAQRVVINLWPSSWPSLGYVYVQVGHAGGIVGSGYGCRTVSLGDGNKVRMREAGYAFLISEDQAAGQALCATIFLTKLNDSSNWIMSSVAYNYGGIAQPGIACSAGWVGIGATLDRVQLFHQYSNCQGGHCVVYYEN